MAFRVNNPDLDVSTCELEIKVPWLTITSVGEAGEYQILLNTDEKKYGGHGLIGHDQYIKRTANRRVDGMRACLELPLPSRTAQVYKLTRLITLQFCWKVVLFREGASEIKHLALLFESKKLQILDKQRISHLKCHVEESK
ncbi:hypothetical protein M9H77_27239 [Catharanthus roseus]|uniref:Uncharacterized protein n=1 Tax=Catharanthus roseus TaxID=4058 RepID=A0ACC0ACY6_CATRO|nr:hypothetical protein M9H77_27239 [Catharanthus roseus]